jgi:hypothetical protein
MARKDRTAPANVGLEIDLETPSQAAETGSLFPDNGPTPEAAAPTPPPAQQTQPAQAPPQDLRARLAAIVAAATSPEALNRGSTSYQADTVQVGRPGPQVGFRTSTAQHWAGVYYLLESRAKVTHGGKNMTRSCYLVMPEVAATFEGRRDSAVKAKRLTLWIDTTGNIGLWAQGATSQGENGWVDTGRAAVIAAQSKWIRVTPDQVGGRYRAFGYPGITAEPNWPTWASDPLAVFERAFGEDGVIWDLSHAALQGLDGSELSLGGEGSN